MDNGKPLWSRGKDEVLKLILEWISIHYGAYKANDVLELLNKRG